MSSAGPKNGVMNYKYGFCTQSVQKAFVLWDIEGLLVNTSQSAFENPCRLNISWVASKKFL